MGCNGMAWKASSNVITQGTANRLHSDYRSSSSVMHFYLFSVHNPVLPLLYIGAWNESGLQLHGVGCCDIGMKKTSIQRWS